MANYRSVNSQISLKLDFSIFELSMLNFLLGFKEAVSNEYHYQKTDSNAVSNVIPFKKNHDNEGHYRQHEYPLDSFNELLAGLKDRIYLLPARLYVVLVVSNAYSERDSYSVNPKHVQIIESHRNKYCGKQYDTAKYVLVL